MELLPGKEGVKGVRNLISEKHQVHAYAVELTAKQVYILNPTGEVDFGGSEYAAAQTSPLPSHQKHSQDRYQWWTLVHGAYQVEFNESLELAEDEIALLEPHERLLRAGAEHPAHFLRGKVSPLTTLLAVGCARLQIKQNARISTLRIFRLTTAGRPAAKPQPAKPVKPAKKKR
ncbi:MAG: dCTP deaminase [Candidatus Acidiferrales bacterium]